MAEEQGKTQPKLTQEERAIKFWKKQNFVHNAIQIIHKAAALNGASAGIYSNLLDKMVHSIFFLGNIHDGCSFYPKEIFYQDDIFRVILETFKGPIEKFTTEVAVRTPFSYFLELVVRSSKNEEEVKDVLENTIKQCKGSGNKYTLISTVICICKVSGKCYYGGSLSCPSNPQREIMTAVSCYHVWDSYVSSAVLSVFPEDRTDPVSMTLPSSVQCRAYAIDNLSEGKKPCLRCHELYSLPSLSDWFYYFIQSILMKLNSDETEVKHHSNHRNEPGNCAETEAISNLLKNEYLVRNETTIKGGVLEEKQIRDRMMEYFKIKIKEREEKKKGNQRKKREEGEEYSIRNIYK